MALAEIRRYSDACDKRVHLNVLLPDVGQPPYPVLYLLHGLSDDSTGWVRKSRVEYYLRDWPLMVVMPDGYRGWYTRNHRGVDYDLYLSETRSYVERFFPTSGVRAIGGLSMGGYGAIRAALRDPHLYRCAVSHSGALIPWERRPALLSPNELEDVFGLSPEGSHHDICALASRSEGCPPLWLDIGLEDLAWLEVNRKVHSCFQSLSIPHEYSESSGAHDWDYWDAQLRQALPFYARHLGIAAV